MNWAVAVVKTFAVVVVRSSWVLVTYAVLTTVTVAPEVVVELSALRKTVVPGR